MGPQRAVVRVGPSNLVVSALPSAPSPPCRWPLETRLPSSTVSLSFFSFFPSPLISHPSPEDDTRPPSPPPPTAPTPPQQPSASAKRGRGGPAARGGKYYQRGGSRPNTDREPPSSEDPPVASDAKQRRRQPFLPFFPFLTSSSPHSRWRTQRGPRQRPWWQPW